MAIDATGGIDYTMTRARLESDAALAALAVLPPSAYRSSLEALARFAIERSY
jgi:octaprenyl-diphosphate synthase